MVDVGLVMYVVKRDLVERIGNSRLRRFVDAGITSFALCNSVAKVVYSVDDFSNIIEGKSIENEVSLKEM